MQHNLHTVFEASTKFSVFMSTNPVFIDLAHRPT